MADELNFLQGAGKNPFKTKTHVPIDQDNTLRSKTIGRIIDLLAYGPIKGVVGGDEGVYLEDTQLKKGDEYNFQGVKTEFREGYPDQEYIKGFPAVETPVEVGVEVKFDTPVIRAISSSDIDAVRVTVRVPSLVQTTDKGDRKEASIPLTVSIRKDSGPWEVRVAESIKGKNTAPYTRSYRIDLYGEGNYEVMVSRGNKESDKDTLQDTLIFDYFVELIDSRLNYPGCALVAIEVDAEDFGTAIPKRGYLTDLRIVKVPDNYDPITRTYSGLWYGGFKQAWTDNPAWCFYDLATDPFIGAGLKNINKWELYEIGRYCDELVDDGYGGQEPRFTFNTFIQSQEKAIEALNMLASVFRGMVYWASDTVEVVADRPSPIKRVFSPSDVIGGEFTYVGTSLDNRHSVVTVMWNDPNENYEQVPEVVEDHDAILALGYKETEVTAFACTSRGQARRIGKWFLYSESKEDDTVTFSLPVQFFDLRPGDLFQISDPYKVGERSHGRVLAKEGNQLTLDGDRSKSLVGWNILINKEDGTLFQGDIASQDGNVIVVSGDTMGVIVGSSCVLTPPEAALLTYRVMTVKEEEGDVYSVEAVSHHPGKYAYIEEGLELPDVPTSNIRTDRLDPPTEIVVESFTYDLAEGKGQGLSIGWTASADSRVDEYVLEMRGPQDENYQVIYVGADLVFDLRDIDPSIPGFWAFRVMSRGEFWPNSIWRELNNVEVQNRLIPLTPTGLLFNTTINSILITPQFSVPGVAEECEFYRATRKLDDHEDVVANSVFVGSNYVVEDKNLPYNTEFHYYVRGVNRYGKSEFYYSPASTDNNVDEILEFITDESKQSEIGKYLGGEIEKVSGIGEGSVNERLDNTKSELEGNIDDTRTELEGKIDSATEDLGGRIDELETDVQDKLEDIEELLEMLDGLDLWRPSDPYSSGDVVQYEGALWKAKKDVPAGIIPEEGEYWEEIGSIQNILSDVNNLRAEVESLMLAEAGLAAKSDRLTARFVEMDEDEDEYLKDALEGWSLGSEIAEQRIVRSKENSEFARELVRMSAVLSGDIYGTDSRLRQLIADNEESRFDFEEETRLQFQDTAASIYRQEVALVRETEAIYRDIENIELEVGDNSVAIGNLEQSLISETEAIYQQIGEVEVKVGDNTASIENLEQLVVSETEAIYQQIEEVELEIEDVDNRVKVNASAIESLEGVVSENSAELRDTYRLSARFSEMDEDEDEYLKDALEGWSLGSEIAEQRIVRSKENSEFARELVRMSAIISEDIYALDLRVRELAASDSSAIYRRIDEVDLRVNQNSAGMVEILDLNVDENSSFGRLISQLDVTSDGQSAIIENLQEVVAGEDGLVSKWGVRVLTDAYGNKVNAGFSIISDQGHDTPEMFQSAFMVQAETMIMVPEGYSVDLNDDEDVKNHSPFVVTDGKLWVNTALINVAEISTAIIGDELKSKDYDTSNNGWRLNVADGSFHIKAAASGGSLEITGDGIVLKEGNNPKVLLGNLNVLRNR